MMTDDLEVEALELQPMSRSLTEVNEMEEGDNVDNGQEEEEEEEV